MCNCGNLLHQVENAQRCQFFIKLKCKFFTLTAIQRDSSNFPYVCITESFVILWNHSFLSFNVILEIFLPHCEMGGITRTFLAKMIHISSFSHCPLACYMVEKKLWDTVFLLFSFRLFFWARERWHRMYISK